MTVVKKYDLKISETTFPEVVIAGPEEASEFARNFYHEDIEIYESMFILMLSSERKTIGYAKISQGGVAGTYVDPRIIAKYCLETLCVAVVVFHNHPSGNLKASPEDKRITKQINDVMNVIGVELYDHIILTKDGFLSFRQEKLL
jgi:DNA repair protein RadC